jgi:hypothetical protein
VFSIVGRSELAESLRRGMIRAGGHLRLSSVLLDARFDIAFESFELVRGGRVVHHCLNDIPQVVVVLSILANSLEAIHESGRVFLLGFQNGTLHVSSKSVLP